MGVAPGLVGPLCALFSSVTWAVGTATYSRLSEKHSVFAINFTRAMVALPCFVLMTFFVSGGFGEGIKSYQALAGTNWSWFLLSVLASYGLGDSLFLLSTRSLGVPGALAIASSYPVWTVLAGTYFLDQRLTPLQLVGVAFTLVGVILVVVQSPKKKPDPLGDESKGSSSPSSIGSPSFSWVGLALALITSVAWATNSFAAARGAYGVLPSVANTARMSIGLVMTVVFGRFLMPGQAVSLPFRTVGRLGGVFLFEAFLGSFLFLYGVSHSPLALGTTLSALSPVISVPVAVFLGLEKFSLYRTLGVIVAVVGVCLIMGTFSPAH